MPEVPPPSILPFDEQRRLVESEFKVTDFYLHLGIPTFVIAPTPTKEPFKRLVSKLKERGYLPLLRKEGETLLIRITPRPPPQPSKPWPNLVLLLATFASVLASGFFSAYQSSLNPVLREVYRYMNQEFNPLTQTLFFSLSIMAVIGIHELGHYITHLIRRVEASLPYFIPAPFVSPLGTFGAVILQKEPPTNRDELFDLGFSGPIVGFAVTLMVTVLGLKFFSFQIPTERLIYWAQQYPGSVGVIEYPPLLFQFLSPILNPPQTGYTTVLTPVATMTFWLLILNFLNLMPAWQLDGGWVALSILGPQRHQTVSYIAAGTMFLLGQPYWFMAMIVLFGMWRGGTGVGPLDNVSPVSTRRKATSLLVVLIIVLSAKFFPYF